MKNYSYKYDCIVIGGGPSGMIAAGRAAELGAHVLLLEKNKQLGKKLLLTGGGRCNITNAIFDVREFLNCFPQSKEFLFSPFSKFSVKDTFDFFEKRGLPLITEAQKRVFPKTEDSKDVLQVLENYMKQGRVEVRRNIKVTSFRKNDNGAIVSIRTSNDEEIPARNFILATGGNAAPETGSTGDGLEFLEKLDHTISKPNPNIVPLRSDTKWVHALSGTTLSFMTIRFKQKDKTRVKKTGKVLFTHFGLSGPLILNSAYEVKKLLEKGKVEASIDMFPDTEENELDRRVWRLFEKNKNKQLKNILHEILQKNLAEEFLKFPDIVTPDREVNSITKVERKALVKKMKNMTLSIIGTMGFDRAVITDGGVILEEVAFKNMSSKIHPNLYLLGDILNINRPSGGFSLQMCWTTGWVAGTDIGEKSAAKHS
ncbi:MAG: NAD(P)/FAD-dependent oxidoreductase [Candidatus Pacebacteria bacterium]|nr:NAD(P)/FAD-dependent oxidoreductase [Candidatus Paceibacterota bacterium]